MKRATATITSKGQITLPVEVRRKLGVRQTDKVDFVFKDDGAIEIQSTPYSIMSLKGSLPPLPGRDHQDFDAMITEAMEEAAEGWIRQLEEN